MSVHELPVPDIEIYICGAKSMEEFLKYKLGKILEIINGFVKDKKVLYVGYICQVNNKRRG